MVSHEFHLARISRDCGRAGPRARTVPAREPVPLGARPWFSLREMAAHAWRLLHPVPLTPPPDGG
jgi:hypothetical protein